MSKLATSLALACALVACSSPKTLRREGPRPPNVVVFLVDDQGWTGTSVQLDDDQRRSRSDYYRTPQLERLAAAGMRFSNAYSSGPNCSPTRCSLQTGLGPARTGMTDIFNRRAEQPLGPVIGAANVDRIADERLTLPEALHTLDWTYRTAHFGKWHIGSGGPERHGFDVSDGPTGNESAKSGFPDDPKRIFSVTERSLEFLREQVERDQPFYLQISHFAVHLEIEALAETREQWSARRPGRRHNVPGYGAMTADLDTGLGMILDELERLGLDENTYVIYASDNGAVIDPDVTNNVPLRGGKTTLWEGGLRVPLVVRGPGIPANSRSTAPTVTHDLYPTIVDLVGSAGAAPDDLDGGSLAPVLFEQASEVARRDEFLVFHFPRYRPSKQMTPQSVILRDGYKLLKDWGDGSYRLYGLGGDVAEELDLTRVEWGLARELDDLLTTYLLEVGAPMPRPNPEWVESVPQP